MTDASPQFHLAAISASTAVLAEMAAGQHGRIAGVHTEALNLMLGQELCTLVNRETGNLPRGIVVDLPEGTNWKRLGLKAGWPVHASNGRMWLAPNAHVDLTSARPWDPKRRLAGKWGPCDDVWAALDAASAELSGAAGLGFLGEHLHALGAGISPELLSGDWIQRRAATSIARVAKQVLTGDASGFLKESAGLVGLGIGLTPSGDDFLVGLVGSLVLLSEWSPGLNWVPLAASRVVADLSGRTTTVSIGYLQCAARGEIIERQEDLLEATAAGNARAAADACRTLRLFGHSSGGEIALGTLLAVQLAASLPTWSTAVHC